MRVLSQRKTRQAALAANLGVQAFATFYHMPFGARLRWFLMGSSQPKRTPTLAEAVREEKAKRTRIAATDGLGRQFEVDQ